MYITHANMTKTRNKERIIILRTILLTSMVFFVLISLTWRSHLCVLYARSRGFSGIMAFRYAQLVLEPEVRVECLQVCRYRFSSYFSYFPLFPFFSPPSNVLQIFVNVLFSFKNMDFKYKRHISTNSLAIFATHIIF